MSLTSEESKELLNNIFYFDVHGHIEKTIPPILRILNRSPIPKDIKLSELKKTGVNGFIICAIGDPNSFRKHKVDAFTSVKKQLTKIKKHIRRVDGIIATRITDFKDAANEKRPVFVLGIEGGDFLEDDPERLSFVYEEGVRVLAPVHYSKNMIGSIEFGWGGRTIPQKEQTGLTTLGRAMVKKANELGIIIDLAHADEKTLMDVVTVTKSPVFCSHTGPRNLQDFPRYISDNAIKAVAGTGGLIGMWPFYYNGSGIRDLNTFSLYAKHIIDLTGADNLAIGTDINGVPGNMEGYENLHDTNRLIHSLSVCNLSEDEIKLVTGGNFIRLFENVMEQLRGSGQNQEH